VWIPGQTAHNESRIAVLAGMFASAAGPAQVRPSLPRVLHDSTPPLLSKSTEFKSFTNANGSGNSFCDQVLCGVAGEAEDSFADDVALDF
jgi:hypothetical protein